MSDAADYSRAKYRAVAELENSKWQRLCAAYLPIAPADSVWRYSRLPCGSDPEQGWKLHISATILSANRVFENVAPYLRNSRAMFKAPDSLLELEKINSGLYYGYCQVGKFITVYPRDPQEAVLLARRLHRLTYRLHAPTVPFDSRFQTDSCVYYRYGAFKEMEIENADGTRTPALRDMEGNYVPDLRYSEKAAPEWVTDPFADEESRRADEPIETPLKTTFRVFRSLAQRGKGGVYQAVDLSTRPPRLCILKEGRRYGELMWDGRDGCWMVKHEKRVLASLRAAGVAAPAVCSSFSLKNNYYLVTEFIEGESLQALLFRRRRRLSVSQVLNYATQLSALLSGIHTAGWIWRDCKPANLMVTKDGKLRPLDFEGACPIQRPDPTPWGTLAFTPPRHRRAGKMLLGPSDDLYALGAVIYFLLTGRLLEDSSRVPLAKLRKNVPEEVCNLVEELLADDPPGRPDVQTVCQRLADISADMRCG